MKRYFSSATVLKPGVWTDFVFLVSELLWTDSCSLTAMGSLFRWALIVDMDEFSSHESTQLFWLASLTPGLIFSCVYQEVITLRKHISTNYIGSKDTAVGNCTTSFGSNCHWLLSVLMFFLFSICCLWCSASVCAVSSLWSFGSIPGVHWALCGVFSFGQNCCHSAEVVCRGSLRRVEGGKSRVDGNLILSDHGFVHLFFLELDLNTSLMRTKVILNVHLHFHPSLLRCQHHNWLERAVEDLPCPSWKLERVKFL